MYGTPPTDDSPIVLLHPDATGAVTWSSVFTVDESNQLLQETFLPATGNDWTSKDLSAQYGTPAIATPQELDGRPRRLRQRVHGWPVAEQQQLAETKTARLADEMRLLIRSCSASWTIRRSLSPG